jgi:hypothetical protein
MELYKCERCGLETKYKGNFEAHKKKKNLCPNLLGVIELDPVETKKKIENLEKDNLRLNELIKNFSKK